MAASKFSGVDWNRRSRGAESAGLTKSGMPDFTRKQYPMDLPSWVFVKDDVLKWRESYDTNENSFNGGIEKQLRSKFQERKCATYDDLLDILKWKFAEMPGRLKRELNLLSTVN